MSGLAIGVLGRTHVSCSRNQWIRYTKESFDFLDLYWCLKQHKVIIANAANSTVIQHIHGISKGQFQIFQNNQKVTVRVARPLAQIQSKTRHLHIQCLFLNCQRNGENVRRWNIFCRFFTDDSTHFRSPKRNRQLYIPLCKRHTAAHI